MAVAGGGVQRHRVVDPQGAAREQGLVLDRGLVGGHRVVVVDAVAAVHPEVRVLAGIARQRTTGIALLARAGRALEVEVVAIGRAAARVAAELVAGEHDAARVVGRAEHQIAALAGGTEQERSLLGVAAGDIGRSPAEAQFGAVEILAQDDVDHATDGVGTVQRGGAVGQHLDALHRRHRDGVEVGIAAQRRRVRRAAAIDQHQSAVRADAAQVDVGYALGAAARARAEVAERGERGIAQHIGHRDMAAGVDRGAVDHGDRHRALDVGALDARAGDFDPVQAAHVRLRLRQRSERDQCGGDAQREHGQPGDRLGTAMFHGFLSR